MDDLFGKLTREEVAHDPVLIKKFDRLDKDGDGVLTFEEFFELRSMRNYRSSTTESLEEADQQLRHGAQHDASGIDGCRHLREYHAQQMGIEQGIGFHDAGFVGGVPGVHDLQCLHAMSQLSSHESLGQLFNKVRVVHHNREPLSIIQQSTSCT